MTQQQETLREGADLPLLAAGATAMGMELTVEHIQRFGRYLDVLLAWNQRLNLTTITDPAAVQVRHFLDSLSCTLVTGDLSRQEVIDVGSGAGFPGVPLKILFPGMRLTLIESAAKKGRFLEALVAGLDLDGVTILTKRAETVGQMPAHRGRYDWALARGLAVMPVLGEYLLPLCRQGGHVLAMKGANAAEETAAAAGAITLLGGGPAQLCPVQLPSVAERHYLVVVQKIAETPERYPRRPGIPTKRPLAGR